MISCRAFSVPIFHTEAEQLILTLLLLNCISETEPKILQFAILSVPAVIVFKHMYFLQPSVKGFWLTHLLKKEGEYQSQNYV